MTTHAIVDPFFLTGEDPPDPRLARWRRRGLALLLLGVAAWAIVTFLVGPPVIRAGYENTSPIAAVNHAFDHRAEHPLDFYIAKWNKLAAIGLTAWLALGALVLGATSPAFARRVVGTATPGALGALRVLTCLVLAYSAYTEQIASVVQMSPADRTSMGVMDFLYSEGPNAKGVPIGFDQLVRSAPALAAYKAVTVALLLAGALGWKTRPVLVLSAVLYLPLLGIVRSYSWLSHSGLVPFYMLVVLIFTRSGDGWSLDRLLKLWRNEPVPASDVKLAHYAWARYAVWLVFALPYVAAGLCKLTNDDWRWWQGINLQTILYTDALRPGKDGSAFILQHAWIPMWAFTAMGVGTVIIEAGFGLVMVSRVARLIWPIMAAAMHVGIWVLQDILFWDLIVLQVMFYDWTAVRHRVGRWVYAKRGSVDVLFDGRCSICRRSVRLLRAFDLFDRLNYLDFRTLDVAAYNSQRGVTLDPVELDKAMHVVWRGRVTSGFEGCRTIAAALPMFWPIVPLLYVPGLSHLGRAGYAWLARNRMAFHKCDPNGACTLPSHEPLVASAQPPVASPNDLPLLRKLLGPIVVICVTCFMMGAWAVRLEWYPFTSMQMFSTYANSGVVTYYRTYMTDSSGYTYEAALENMGRGMRRFRPILSGGFYDDAGRAKLLEMLEFCGRTHNASNPPNPCVKLEVEKRVWDFVNDRRSPTRGQAVDRIAVHFDVPATRTAGAE